MPEGAIIVLLLGLVGLAPSLLGGVHMLPWGWVYRREQPAKFWFILAVQVLAICLFTGVMAFGLSR